jgi:hypothetical protein
MDRTVAALSAAVGALAAVVVGLVIVILSDHRVVGGHGEAPREPTAGEVRVLDDAALEHDIAAQYEERFTQEIQVDCPEGEPARSDVVFTCSVAASTQKIQVSVKDADGNYVWRVTD